MCMGGVWVWSQLVFVLIVTIQQMNIDFMKETLAHTCEHNITKKMNEAIRVEKKSSYYSHSSIDRCYSLFNFCVFFSPISHYYPKYMLFVNSPFRISRLLFSLLHSALYAHFQWELMDIYDGASHSNIFFSLYSCFSSSLVISIWVSGPFAVVW